MNILVRGDCTSRRSIFFNRDLFPADASVIQNEKSPAIFFVDHMNGIDMKLEQIEPYVDFSKMPSTHKRFFLGQFDRSIFRQKKADLLVLDSYADMNFELFEPVDAPGKFWINRKYMKDMEAFNKRFRSIGRRTLDQSVEDTIELIRLVRQKYGEIPVILLNQQVEPYPKLHARREYYELGRLVSERIRNCEYGGHLGSQELGLADIGSSGPGLTLHYTGDTYRKMLERISFLRQLRTSGSASFIQSQSNQVAKSSSPTQKSMPQLDPNEEPLGICLKPDDRDPPYRRETIFTMFDKYFIIPEFDNYDPRALPAIIELDQVQEYTAWVRRTKKDVGDNAFRSEKKALQRGYFVEMFNEKTFVPDIHAINTSMPVRNGRRMKPNYTRSIEELGGYPTTYHQPKIGKDPLYWSVMFGAFLSVPGWKQGEIVTDKRLVGYVRVRRIGDAIFYPQLLGHGDYLLDGIMAQIHFHILRWITSRENDYSSGAKILMYANANISNEGLRTWKKRAGFKPRKISLVSF